MDLPIFIYTIGKNEYIENADDHRLNQRTDLDYSLRNEISDIMIIYFLFVFRLAVLTG